MKLFILLTFYLTFLSAEIQNITNGSCENCGVLLSKKHVEKELKTILFQVKTYKKKQNLEVETLRKKLLSVEKRFSSYKSNKTHENRQIKKSYVKKLNTKNSQIKALQHELTLIKQQLAQKKKTIISLKQKLIQKNQPILSTIVPAKVENTPKVEIIPKKWIKIIVNNNLNIYDLALKYYGDSQEYEKIYKANKNKLNKNYQIKNGISLKIPITKNFIK